MLRWAVERSRATGLFDQIVCVIGKSQREIYDQATFDLELPVPALGGVTRRASVLNGLEALASLRPDIVSIQDAARPLVDATELRLLIERVGVNFDGAIPALPVVDTLKRGKQAIAETVPREGLWQAQTPQVFSYPQILAAHRQAAGLPEARREALTDDAAVGELAGLKIALVTGRPENFKVTTPADIERLDRMLHANAAMETRIGTGFDVHAFGPGDHVMLGGVRIGHERGLVGHSDADVALHALTDAILGAIGAGDIGQHFPPADPQWRDAASERFLQHAGTLLAERGGRLVNADLTVICERPKIGPHRQAMTVSIARTLGVSPARISVKATTTEKLGFTGRGEGIAVQAMVSVTLPTGD